MKKLFMLLVLIFISLGTLAAYAQTAQPAEADYTNWLFVQSDKALQYRYAVAKKEGSVSYLKLQFRVKSDDEVHCRSSQCDGYVLYLTYRDLAYDKTIAYHYYFSPSFIGDKVYNFPDLVPIEFKSWEDGSKVYLNKEKGVVYTEADGTDSRTGKYFWNCVDYKLNNTDDQRCRDYSPAKAVRVD